MADRPKSFAKKTMLCQELTSSRGPQLLAASATHWAQKTGRKEHVLLRPRPECQRRNECWAISRVQKSSASKFCCNTSEPSAKNAFQANASSRQPSPDAQEAVASGVMRSEESLRTFLGLVEPGFEAYAPSMWVNGKVIVSLSILASAESEALKQIGVHPLHIGRLKQAAKAGKTSSLNQQSNHLRVSYTACFGRSPFWQSGSVQSIVAERFSR